MPNRAIVKLCISSVHLTWWFQVSRFCLSCLKGLFLNRGCSMFEEGIVLIERKAATKGNNVPPPLYSEVDVLLSNAYCR